MALGRANGRVTLLQSKHAVVDDLDIFFRISRISVFIAINTLWYSRLAGTTRKLPARQSKSPATDLTFEPSALVGSILFMSAYTSHVPM